MMRDLFNPRRRNVAAPQDICEKGADVVDALRTTKGNQQDGVERRHPEELSYGEGPRQDDFGLESCRALESKPELRDPPWSLSEGECERSPVSSAEHLPGSVHPPPETRCKDAGAQE